MKIKTRFEMGHAVADQLTGFAGVVTAFATYCTECDQYLVQPRANASGEWQEPRWFDVDRLTKTHEGIACGTPERKPTGGPVHNAAPRK